MFIDWCAKEGCGEGGEQEYTLTQRIPASRNAQTEICADLKLQDGKLKYTQIGCDEERKPLCMKGDPVVKFTDQTRFSKLRHLKKQRKKLLCRKQKLLKARLKLLNKKLRKETALSRQVRQSEAVPVDMCLTGGEIK